MRMKIRVGMLATLAVAILMPALVVVVAHGDLRTETAVAARSASDLGARQDSAPDALSMFLVGTGLIGLGTVVRKTT